jgi:hypothetical protein
VNFNNFMRILLTLFILVGALMALPVQSAAAANSYDVIVVGAGTGGFSAAIAARRSGARTLLIEETGCVGGQMTCAGISTLDEGMVCFNADPNCAFERSSGLYAELVQRLAAVVPLSAVHKCYYADFALCPDPGTLQRVIDGWLSEEQSAGNLDVLLNTSVTSVLKNGSTVSGVVARLANGSIANYTSAVVVDATEYGDLLPLAGAAYRLGKTDTKSGLNLGDKIQDITYSAIIKRYDGGIPANLRINSNPPGYTDYLPKFQAMVGGVCNPEPYARPKCWEQHTRYRGVSDPQRLNSATAATLAQSSQITLTGVNFANDYPVTGRTVENRSQRQADICAAALETINFLRYIQASGQNWSIADNVGFERFQNAASGCTNIPAEYAEIVKRLPVMPYVREARRLIGVDSITSWDLQAQKRVDPFHSPSVQAISYKDACAMGAYNTDLHGSTNPADLNGGTDNIADLTEQHAPFQVSCGAMIPEIIDGLLATEKNDDEGRLVSGASRLQPSTMLKGQAAGVLAAKSAQLGVPPRRVATILVQHELVRVGSKLSLSQFHDVDRGTPGWEGIQIASLYGFMLGNGGWFDPAGELTRGQGAVVIARWLKLPAGNESEAIASLQSRGIAQSGNFNAGDMMTKDHLSLFLARSLSQQPVNGEEARKWLTLNGIVVGCENQSCLSQRVARWSMALAVSDAMVRQARGGATAQTNEPVAPTADPFGGWFDGVWPTGSVSLWSCGPRVDLYVDGDGFGRQIGVSGPNYTSDDQSVLEQECGSGGNKRFLFQVPDDLRDGRTHTIYAYTVYPDGQWKEVPNSGQVFTMGAKTPFGYVDFVDTQGRITGWACDPRDTTRALEIRVNGLAGGEVQIASGLAGLGQEWAVGYACAGHKAHRFVITLPPAALSQPWLRVYAVGIGGEVVTLVHPDWQNNRVSTTDRRQPPSGY